MASLNYGGRALGLTAYNITADDAWTITVVFNSARNHTSTVDYTISANSTHGTMFLFTMEWQATANQLFSLALADHLGSADTAGATALTDNADHTLVIGFDGTDLYASIDGVELMRVVNANVNTGKVNFFNLDVNGSDAANNPITRSILWFQ